MTSQACAVASFCKALRTLLVHLIFDMKPCGEVLVPCAEGDEGAVVLNPQDMDLDERQTLELHPITMEHFRSVAHDIIPLQIDMGPFTVFQGKA